MTATSNRSLNASPQSIFFHPSERPENASATIHRIHTCCEGFLNYINAWKSKIRCLLIFACCVFEESAQFRAQVTLVNKKSALRQLQRCLDLVSEFCKFNQYVGKNPCYFFSRSEISI